MTKRIAIIPARGGSKRIPRKNIKDFLGKPIIAYSIEAAKESNLFDEIMVSTDDEEIAKIALEYGANVPFMRQPETSDDYASTLDVIQEVIHGYKAEGSIFEIACCIYATTPFVTPSLLKASEALLIKGYDSVFPVIPFGFPIQRALRFNGDKVEMLNSEYQDYRSQDLEKAYQDCGMFYWMNVEKVMSKGKLWTDNSSSIVLSELDAHDIDNPEDWKVAEFKYSLKQSG